MDALLASGTVSDSPEEIAAFLREHREVLDTMQIGEYFGHHEEQAVSFCRLLLLLIERFTNLLHSIQRVRHCIAVSLNGKESADESPAN